MLGGEILNTLQVQKKDLSVLFFMFANLYRAPDLELWEEISEEGYINILEDLTKNLSGTEKEWIITDFPKSLNEWKQFYFQSIHGGGKEANLLVESIHKIWTTDSSCGMPFARSKGYLLGDSAMHIRFLLEKFEITIPVEFSNTPDHLVILLELLAYFTENAPEDFTIRFIEDHFDWLDDLIEKLADQQGNRFYLQTTGLLRNTLESIKNHS